MDYRFDITITETDYLDFNRFHVLESAAGKKVNRKGKLTILAVFLGAILLSLVGYGWNADFFFYLAIMVPLGILSICFFNKLELFVVKLSIRQLKKRGKLPFDEQTTYEFYEDKFVQTVPDRPHGAKLQRTRADLRGSGQNAAPLQKQQPGLCPAYLPAPAAGGPGWVYPVPFPKVRHGGVFLRKTLHQRRFYTCWRFRPTAF